MQEIRVESWDIECSVQWGPIWLDDGLLNHTALVAVLRRHCIWNCASGFGGPCEPYRCCKNTTDYMISMADKRRRYWDSIFGR